MIYRKLKRTWSHNDAHHIPNFKKVFPEPAKLDNEELCNRFIDLNIEFYYEEKTPINFWTRLTLPFALIIMILMFISLPLTFIVTGQWGYSLGSKNRLYNWFKSLRLQ